MSINFLCFGHRGAMGHAPENTLLSFSKAIEMGVDFIELDVYLIEDKLVVFHDRLLDRFTNASGCIEECSVDYLRSLVLEDNQHIPFLEEVLDLVDGRVNVNIEIKGEGVAQNLVRVLKSYINKKQWTHEHFLISSFIHQEIFEVKNIFSELRIGALTGNIPLNYAEFAEELKAYSVHMNIEFINQKFVDDAHSRNLKAFVYTVNKLEDVRKMYRMGVDGVFTNYPDIVKEYLNSMG